jgi:hypothetical protein
MIPTISFQRSGGHTVSLVYLDYRGWRADNGKTARIQEMRSTPISVRFFDDVATGAA